MSNNEIIIFCKNISYLRKKNNLSKTEMCKTIKIGLKSLNLIEIGIIPPKISCEIIFNISKAFHIEPKNLFELNEE